MPCGQQLIDAVEACLVLNCRTPRDVHKFIKLDEPVSLRAIRYAITELIKLGRAKRDGRQGPVYAVRNEP